MINPVGAILAYSNLSVHSPIAPSLLENLYVLQYFKL
jgi:hypothetical protein